MSDRLDEIEAQLGTITPGPWRWDENFGEDGDTGLALTNDAGAEIVGAYNHHCCSFRDDPIVQDAEAKFIAEAPETVDYLLTLARKQAAALERVRALAKAWESRGEHDMKVSKTITEEYIAMEILGHGAQMVENARHIRNALKEKS